jgi:hypothetical protein
MSTVRMLSVVASLTLLLYAIAITTNFTLALMKQWYYATTTIPDEQ